MQSNSGGGFGAFIQMIRDALDEAMDPTLGSPTGERAPRRQRPRPERRRATTVDVDQVPREVEQWREPREEEPALGRPVTRASRQPHGITAESLRTELRRPDALRRAVVLTEILGKPRGLQRGRGQELPGW